MSTPYLSPCLHVNNKVVNFCNKKLESDFTENDSNVAINSGKNINETLGETNSKENNIIPLEQNVRRSNHCNKGVPPARYGVNY